MPRLPVALPLPRGPVPVGDRRTLDGLACPTHEARGLVAEVHVLPLDGPIGQEAPEDLVGLGAPGDPHVREEHQVSDGLLVQLEVLEDLYPEGLGTRVTATLDGLPVQRELLVDPQEELVFEEIKVRVVPKLEVPKKPIPSHGRRLRVLRALASALKAIARTFLAWRSFLPPLLARGTRRPLRTLRRLIAPASSHLGSYRHTRTLCCPCKGPDRKTAEGHEWL